VEVAGDDVLSFGERVAPELRAVGVRQ